MIMSAMMDLKHAVQMLAHLGLLLGFPVLFAPATAWHRHFHHCTGLNRAGQPSVVVDAPARLLQCVF